MGKALNCFRGFLGLKKRPDDTQTTKRTKKKWSFIKSYRSEKDYYQHHYDPQPLNAAHTSYHGTLSTSFHGGNDVGLDPTKHAIAIAEATAIAAEAAIAAAQAAATVAKLRSSGRFVTTTSSVTCVSRTGAASWNREEWAAILIQSHFRAYLARRALRALKGLVKLQAVVRGHIVRKQTADTQNRRQALVTLDPATPEKLEHAVRHRNMKLVKTFMLKQKHAPKSNVKATDPEELYMIHTDCRKIDASSRKHSRSFAKSILIDDDKIDKIVKIDIEKPYVNPKNFFQSSHTSLNSEQYSYNLPISKDSTARHTVTTPSSHGSQSMSPLKLNQDADEQASFCTADNNPTFSSTSSKAGISRRRLFTTTNNASRSCPNGHQDHPNFMSYTESAKAKLQSTSEPKQRPPYKRSSTMKRYSVNGYSESRKVSAYHPNFTNKAYPPSVRLDRSALSGGPLRRC